MRAPVDAYELVQDLITKGFTASGVKCFLEDQEATDQLDLDQETIEQAYDIADEYC
jgi:hypothetical protein